MSSRHDKEYAPVKGHQDTCCDGRKKSSKKKSHRLLRSYYKRQTQKEVIQSVDNC